MPAFPFRFEPFRRQMYSPHELFAGFDPRDPQSFAATLDFAIYREYIAAGKNAPNDYFASMMQAVHDNAITQSLSDHLRTRAARAVGIMGGHKLPRGSGVYRQVVNLALDLTRRRFTMVSGGGPGAMEATHLGAMLSAGAVTVDEAVAKLSTKAEFPDVSAIVAPDGTLDRALVATAHAWIRPAHELLPSIQPAGESIAIPTWMYGHEPTIPFATSIAKYFQNSIREDGLLGIAGHGVVYVEGSAGTLQEVFQDAAQNYYRTFGAFSPMVFLGRRQWTETLPVVAVLEKLFTKEDLAQSILVTDDAGEAADFIDSRAPKEQAADRMDRYLHSPQP